MTQISKNCKEEKLTKMIRMVLKHSEGGLIISRETTEDCIIQWVVMSYRVCIKACYASYYP